MLEPIIDLLATISEVDHLRDLRDLIRWKLESFNKYPRRIPRYGIYPLGNVTTWQPFRWTVGTDDSGQPILKEYDPRPIKPIWELTDQLKEPDLNLLLKIVILLYRAMTPRYDASDKRGHIQIKEIKKLQIDRETGETVRDMEGNPVFKKFYYAYLRVWVTGGNVDHQKTKLKSIYLGKPVRDALWDCDPDQREKLERAIIEAYHEGRLEDFLSSLESQLGNAEE